MDVSEQKGLLYDGSVGAGVGIGIGGGGGRGGGDGELVEG